MAGMIVVLNGPNLNMLGTREPEIYGSQSLEDIRKLCEECASSLSLKLEFFQTNNEGQLVDQIHQAAAVGAAGIIINPGAYGHTSIALLDALLSISVPAVEVHLSNLHKREAFRHQTYTSRAARGVIAGFGGYGYCLAMYALNEILKKNA